MLLLLACTGAEPTPPVDGGALVFRLEEAGPVETWRTEEGQGARFDRRTGMLHWRDQKGSEQEVRTRLAWSTWGLLELCLGSPVRERPGGDPGGRRLLVIQGKDVAWRMVLSGINRCSLGGRVSVDAVSDRVHTGHLTVDGVAWDQGGQQRAVSILRERERASVLADWESLQTMDRILLLKRLGEDPDPRAESVLLALRAKKDGHTADIDAALEQRSLRLVPALNP